jgi:ParB-like chromosome segregation protein Spo0J
MDRRVKLACESEMITLKLSGILPLKTITVEMKRSVKYHCIVASVRELGVIEPLVVYPDNGNTDNYVLLDGHIRLEVLKNLGHDTVECLIAMDDEAFTYNHKVNRLSAIQEHFMIIRAIKRGVSEERIAKSLNVDVANICRKRDLLDGICREAVVLLKDRRPATGALREMKKVKAMRQIEMAELMIASQNFSVAYAKCLYAATPADQLVEADKPKEVGGLSAREVGRMERELESLSQDFKLVEETHGRNVLNLVLVVSYLKKLLDNAGVVRCLSRNYPEILTEFQKVTDAKSLANGE